ncbi:MAG: putative Ig domain-containing protein [Marmoricola sp.]
MTLRRTLTLGFAGLLVASGATLTATAAQAQPAGCTPALAKAARAGDVARNNPSAFKKAEARNAGRMKNFAHVAKTDKTLWLDACATAYYVENTASAAELQASQASVAASAPLTGVPLTDTFTLQSRPGSKRTIYLDVKGGTLTGTAWNNTYGASLTFEPYSNDATIDTNFSDSELTEIQKIWQSVAEDYAAFDVNVTLADPGAAAIDRTDSNDLVYGTRALITNGGTVYTQCGCGGIAYVGVFNSTGSTHGYYQPALVFSNGTGKGGKNIGEATAHEVGHNFGLNHDGTATAGYYTGSSPWAPIMGASYYQPVTQWSKGEYPGANNQQDDLAQIATGAPVVADEDPGTALPLANNASANGVITSAADVDRYSFTAAGSTTVNVAGTTFSDLDVQLRILDSNGVEVTSANPTTTAINSNQVNGMGASATFTAPAAGAVYTATIQGSGQGDPAVAGGYSAYASIGNYAVSLATGSPTSGTPLAISVGAMANATVGTGYASSPVSASGGTAPYTFSATGLPAGLSISAATGAVTGTPTTAGSYTPSFTVTDNAGGSASQAGAITVDPAPIPPVVVQNQSGSGTVGTAFSHQLAASGGTGTFTWSSSGTLPPGLALSASGLLSGTPTTTGTYAFTATASSGGNNGSGTVTITVAAPAAPLAWVTGATLPTGKVKSAYSSQIKITGGTAAYTWLRTAGSVPNGTTLSFSGTTATLSGKPSKAGTFRFTLRVTDSKGVVISQQFTVVVNR